MLVSSSEIILCCIIEGYTAAVGAGADQYTSCKLPVSDFLVCLPTVSGKQDKKVILCVFKFLFNRDCYYNIVYGFLLTVSFTRPFQLCKTRNR